MMMQTKVTYSWGICRAGVWSSIFSAVQYSVCVCGGGVGWGGGWGVRVQAESHS